MCKLFIFTQSILRIIFRTMRKMYLIYLICLSEVLLFWSPFILLEIIFFFYKEWSTEMWGQEYHSFLQSYIFKSYGFMYNLICYKFINILKNVRRTKLHLFSNYIQPKGELWLEIMSTGMSKISHFCCT